MQDNISTRKKQHGMFIFMYNNMLQRDLKTHTDISKLKSLVTKNFDSTLHSSTDKINNNNNNNHNYYYCYYYSLNT